MKAAKLAALVPLAAVVLGLAAPAGAEVVPEIGTVVNPVYSLPKMPAPMLAMVEPAAPAAAPLIVVRPEVVADPVPFAPVVAPAPIPASGATLAPTVGGTTFTRPATTRRSPARGAPRRTLSARRPSTRAPVLAFVAPPTRTLLKNVTVTSPPVDPRPVYAQIALVRLLTGSLW